MRAIHSNKNPLIINLSCLERRIPTAMMMMTMVRISTKKRKHSLQVIYLSAECPQQQQQTCPLLSSKLSKPLTLFPEITHNLRIAISRNWSFISLLYLFLPTLFCCWLSVILMAFFSSFLLLRLLYSSAHLMFSTGISCACHSYQFFIIFAWQTLRKRKQGAILTERKVDIYTYETRYNSHSEIDNLCLVYKLLQ